MPNLDEDTNMVDVVNTTSEPMKFELDGQRFVLKFKETAKVLKVHAYPKVLQEGRDPVASTIEMLTNGKVVPVTHKKAKALGLGQKSDSASA